MPLTMSLAHMLISSGKKTLRHFTADSILSSLQRLKTEKGDEDHEIEMANKLNRKLAKNLFKFVCGCYLIFNRIPKQKLNELFHVLSNLNQIY
jgi:hypothetical protein